MEDDTYMIIRKTAAVLLIAALCLGLTSCGYNPETVGKVTGPDGFEKEITCGEYLAAQYEVVFNIVQQAGITGNQQIDMTKLMELETSDGGTIREYVADAVSQTLINRMVTDYLYDRADIAEDDATKIYFDNYIQEDWASNSSYMLQNGIGYESFRTYEMQILKASQIPYVLYGKGGEKELSEEYISEYMETKVGRYTYLNLPYRKAMGVENTASDIAKLKSYAQEILDAVTSGHHIDISEPKDIIADAANEYTDKYQSLLGYYQEMSSITSENVLLLYGNGTFTTDQYDQIFRVGVGEYAIIEGEDGLFTIVYRHELGETDTADNLFNEIITAVAGSMFSQYIAETAEKFSIELDEKATAYYSPDKIVM